METDRIQGLSALREVRHKIAGELHRAEAKEDRAIRNHDSENALRLLAEIIGLKKALKIVRREIKERQESALF